VPFRLKKQTKSLLLAALHALSPSRPIKSRFQGHDRLERAAAGQPQARQDSRSERPAPPAAALTGLRLSGSLAAKRSWLRVSEVAPVAMQAELGAVA
jgi:hypothetical protein